MLKSVAIDKYWGLTDTGAGVIICRTRAPEGTGMVFLPGHALIDGKLVSKPMLEPSDQPGVTMGDRVEALEKALDGKSKTLTEVDDRHKQEIRDLKVHHATILDKLKSQDQASQTEILRLRAELDKMNQGLLQVVSDDRRGILSFLGRRG